LKPDTDSASAALTFARRHAVSLPAEDIKPCPPPVTLSDPALIELASLHDSNDPTVSSTAADGAAMLLPVLHAIDSLALTTMFELACSDTPAPTATLLAITLRLTVLDAPVTVQPTCTVSPAVRVTSGHSTLLLPLKEMLPSDLTTTEGSPAKQTMPEPTPDTSKLTSTCSDDTATRAEPRMSTCVAENNEGTLTPLSALSLPSDVTAELDCTPSLSSTSLLLPDAVSSMYTVPAGPDRLVDAALPP
jgi:hypothetical protein